MDDSSCSQRKEIFLNLLSSLEAEDILKPISQVKVFRIDESFEYIIDTIKQNKYSYYPVYDDGIDNIIGILHIKDLIGINTEFNLQQIIKPAVFISENTGLDDLYIMLDKKEVKLAIVVDEHGSVRGVVTHGDIRQAIYQDTDDLEHEYILSFNDPEYLVDAKMPLDDFNQHFKTDLNSEDCDTIGGFLIEQFTYVPQNNEMLSFETISITVQKIEGAKLLELAVKRL